VCSSLWLILSQGEKRGVSNIISNDFIKISTRFRESLTFKHIKDYDEISIMSSHNNCLRVHACAKRKSFQTPNLVLS
jgi:hypothetical protein